MQVKNSNIQDSSQINVNQPEFKADYILNKIGKIALKMLAVLAIAVGSVGAIGGMVVLTKLAIASSIVAPLFVIGWGFGMAALRVSVGLMSNEVTALGAAITLPIAAVGFALPLIPMTVGLVPGAGLVSLGVWAWKKLSE